MEQVVFNWRDELLNDKCILSPVRRQAKNACMVSALVATVEARYRIQMELQQLDSSQFNLSVEYAMYYFNDIAWPPSVDLDDVLQSGLTMAQNVGFIQDEDYVNEHTFGHLRIPNPRFFTIDNFESIELNDRERIVQELTQNGPLVAKIIAREQLKKGKEIYRNGGEAKLCKLTGKPYSHAISIMGINDQEEYWDYQNSYGTGWGWDGFGKVDPTVIRALYAPVVVLPDV